jgi:hypothetical protein
MRKYQKTYTVEEYVISSTSGTNEAGESYWKDKPSRSGFFGTTDPDEARQLGLFGWPEGRAIIERLKAQIDQRLGLQNRQYVPVHEVSGAYVDVGRYCEGVPECMLTFEESESPQAGFVSIHVSTGVNACVTTEEIQVHGAAVGALVDALESVGQRVKLTWERSSYGGDWQITLSMTLKDYDQPLDLDRLGFFLTHNAPRRIMAWHEYLKSPKRVRCALGVTAEGVECWATNDAELASASDLHIVNIDARTQEDAARWVLGELEKLGVTLKP